MQPNQPLTLADHRLLDLVWPNQPLPSGRLCQIAQMLDDYRHGH